MDGKQTDLKQYADRLEFLPTYLFSAVQPQRLVELHWLGGQTPNNYRCREHEGPRNQMISGPGRPIEYMLYQKR